MYSQATAAGCGPVQTIPAYSGAPDQAHIGAEVPSPPPLTSYQSTPPVSGPHAGSPLDSSVYDTPPDVYRTIHSLEHGAAVVWYEPSTSGSELDSIKAFFDDLDGHGKSHDVLFMTWSEFGRRVQDNASRGTDHGTAAPHLVVGDAVKPGIYGGPPGLTNLDSNGNLKIENDFRSYYGTILSDWLRADSAAILGAGWPNLGFVNKAYI